MHNIISYLWRPFCILITIILIILFNYRFINIRKEFISKCINTLVLSTIVILILTCGFILEPILWIILNNGLDKCFDIIKDKSVDFLHWQFDIFFIIAVFAPIISYNTSKGDSLKVKIINASVLSIITLILIDIFINIIINENINIQSIFFSLYNDAIPGIIAGIIIGLLINRFDKFNRIIVTINEYRLLSIILSSLLFVIISNYFIFFYKNNTSYTININKWGLISFINSEKNKEYIINDMGFIPLNVNNVFINPNKHIQINLESITKDNNIRQINNPIFIGRFKFEKLISLGNNISKGKFRPKNMQEVKKIFSDIYVKNITDGMISITGNNFSSIFGVTSYDNYYDMVYFFENDKRVTFMKDMQIVWKKNMLGNLFNEENTIFLVSEGNKKHIDIKNWKTLSIIFINETNKNDLKNNMLKIELPGDDKPINMLNGKKISDNLVGFGISAGDNEKIVTINDEKCYVVQCKSNQLVGKLKKLIVNDIYLKGCKGSISIGGNDREIKEGDFIVINGKENTFVMGMGNELIIFGESRGIICNTKELSYTIWSSLGIEIQVALIAGFFLVVTSLLIYYLGRIDVRVKRNL